jgi:UDP-3-O-[3-hydroxymyristoyl] glucosamine N-acyltransferase
MTLGELARIAGGRLHGDANLKIRGVNGLAQAEPGEITFFSNPRYQEALKATRASAVLVGESALALLGGRDAIVVEQPSLAFARVSAAFHPRPEYLPGIDPRAVVEEGALVDPSATVMAFAFVSRDARVGARAVLHPAVFVGERAEIGAEALLYPNVVVRELCRVGARTVVQPGAIIGGDGFGFAFDSESQQHTKVPQAGNVEIEEDVEIGANAAIDRATLGHTRIGRGTKIDNLVQIGHNVQVGPLCILCGQTGIAGSTELGAGVICAGQVGVADHLKVADHTKLGPKAGVMSDIEEPGYYLGTPPIKAREFMRREVVARRSGESARDLKRLEKRVAELEAKLEALTKR